MVKLYVEGAGQTDLARSQCREAFSTFFEAAGLAGKRPRTVPCGGRQAAFDAFQAGIAGPRNGELVLLLVDSEGPVQPNHSNWDHLKARDNWDRPTGATDDQAFLMVQVMETWFLADRAMLRAYFGAAVRVNHLAAWPDLEAVPKDDVLRALDMASAACGARRYAKGRTSFVMLEKLDAQKVRAACPHARQLLERLEQTQP
jgi:hypothetical protein